MSRELGKETSVGFWRHVPWMYLIGLVVSTVLVLVLDSYYNDYGGAILILWGSVIGTAFRESRNLERKRIAEGHPHPAHGSSTNAAEVAITVALSLITGALVVLFSYINIGSDNRSPTPTEAVLAGVALLVSGIVIAVVVLRARRKNRREDGAATRGQLPL